MEPVEASQDGPGLSGHSRDDAMRDIDDVIGHKADGGNRGWRDHRVEHEQCRCGLGADES